ncbi:hypothetical protein [Microbacterium sp. SS28]|uniref:hypothetical protein n=1 Tax=Microbacterium sp. SS28 TaxID=2919948 RepID=UPI001FAB347C|nr:hypothetical protein [Microbacterium sp. SS28]
MTGIGGIPPLDDVDEAADADGGQDAGGNQALRGGMVKALLAVLVNVGVLTALLVYFGWVRSDRMATLLGIDEAILGMTVDDYVRRSVQSVFILPVLAAAAGLVWVGFDQWFQRRRARLGDDERIVQLIARWLWVVAVGLFLVGIVMVFIGYAATYVLWPLVCAAGLLLLLYSFGLRAHLTDSVGFAPLTEGVLRGSIAVLVAVGLFWSATNFATVQGTELAREFPQHVASLPSVEVDSVEPLDIVAPGVETSCLGEGRDIRYHYRGLRLLESTGGNYFLISDGWTPQYGVVVVLPIGAEGLRYSFVRDVSGDSRDADYPPCEEATS